MNDILGGLKRLPPDSAPSPATIIGTLIGKQVKVIYCGRNKEYEVVGRFSSFMPPALLVIDRLDTMRMFIMMGAVISIEEIEKATVQ